MVKGWTEDQKADKSKFQLNLTNRLLHQHMGEKKTKIVLWLVLLKKKKSMFKFKNIGLYKKNDYVLSKLSQRNVKPIA